jgi:hypothetical protein
MCRSPGAWIETPGLYRVFLYPRCEAVQGFIIRVQVMPSEDGNSISYLGKRFPPRSGSSRHSRSYA